MGILFANLSITGRCGSGVYSAGKLQASLNEVFSFSRNRVTVESLQLLRWLLLLAEAKTKNFPCSFPAVHGFAMLDAGKLDRDLQLSTNAWYFLPNM